MRSAYRVFAYLVALEVVIQAAAIAYAVFGLDKWIDNGNTLNKSTMDSSTSHVTGVAGFAIHGINGTMIVPLIGLLFLIVSFFAKIPGGVKWATLTFVTVILQVALGLAAHSVPALGAVHGLLALVLFGVAVMAGKRVGSTTGATTAERQEASRV
jgi:hypothetical protein